jgi:hypothetical protein
MLAASSINARTGVIPRVPIISALVIKAPTQCDKLISSGPDTPGKEILVATGEADHLVRKYRPNNDHNVSLCDMAIDAHVDGGVSQQSPGELSYPVSTDGSHCGERLRQPEFMIEHMPLWIRLLELAKVVSEMSRKMLIGHALMGTKSDYDCDRGSRS